MKTQEPKTKIIAKPKKYHAIANIFELFGISKFPYRTRISFVPLINYWKEKLKSENRVEQMIAEKICAELKKIPELSTGPIKSLNDLNRCEELIELLTSVFIPFQKDENLIRLAGPFNTFSFYDTPSLEKLLKTKSISISLDKDSAEIFQFVIYRTGCLILNQLYGQHLALEPPYIFSVKHDNSLLEKHFKTEIDSRFLEVKKLKPLKKLSQARIQQLLKNVYDIDLWLKYLPPSNFEIQGVIANILDDITLNETLSRIKDRLLKKDALVSEENIKMLESKLSTVFNQKDLRLGIYTLDYPSREKSSIKYGISHCCWSNNYSNVLSRKNQGSIYELACRKREHIIVEDLSKFPNPTLIESELLSEGIKSIIIAPLMNQNDHVIGLLEIGSSAAFAFNSLSVIPLNNVVPLFNVAIERSREEIDNQIEAIIKEKFTSIHPSVEWAFIEKAFEIFNKKNELSDITKNNDSFVFRDNYPLYGQADIVDSTITRNKAIQADLIDNLYMIKKVLIKTIENRTFPLAEQMLMEIDTYADIIKKGASSANENLIIEFIKKEIHPLFRQIRKKYPVIKDIQKTYFALLDSELGIVYRKRKDYEISVTTINKTISDYLDKQQVIAQGMIPHYFEKFQTDGVSYNIYTGQSLLKKGTFDFVHLRNLRLWQLISICEITRLLDDLKPKLPVPLTTAQLILVHSTPLSIRFRVDEKRFDVDGAYNARYEIIKKRIDKAIVEGTNERLTKAGKVAIVYQFEKDKKEYLRYLNFLIKKGIIYKEIEDLPLKRLQGTQGLKALRVKVKVKSGNGNLK